MNNLAGLSQDWARVKKLLLCFFFGPLYAGEETKHMSKIPRKSRDNPRTELFSYVLPALLQKLAADFLLEFFCREILLEIWREFCRISSPPKKGSKISGKIGAIFGKCRSIYRKKRENS